MKFLVVLVACAVIYCEAKPAQLDTSNFDTITWDGDSSGTTINECHGISCPAGTVACSKSTKTSEDKKTLLTTIKCEDYNGNPLNSATKSAENPFEDTQISSFSFTGHYNFNNGVQTGAVHRPSPYDGAFNYNNYNTNTNHNDFNDDVEIFAK